MPRKFIERFKYIDHLISIKATGTPKELAERLDISESTLYEFIKVMKEYGAPIKYDSHRDSYFYEVDGNFNIFFLKK